MRTTGWHMRAAHIHLHDNDSPSCYVSHKHGQHTTMHHNTPQCTTMHHNAATQFSTMHHNTQCSTKQHNAAQCLQNGRSMRRHVRQRRQKDRSCAISLRHLKLRGGAHRKLNLLPCDTKADDCFATARLLLCTCSSHILVPHTSDLNLIPCRCFPAVAV